MFRNTCCFFKAVTQKETMYNSPMLYEIDQVNVYLSYIIVTLHYQPSFPKSILSVRSFDGHLDLHTHFDTYRT